MMRSKKTLNVYSDSVEYIDTIKDCEAAVTLFSLPSNLLIVCRDNVSSPQNMGIADPCYNKDGHPYLRVLLLFTSLPIKLDGMAAWKKWIFDNGIPEAKIDFLRIGDFDKGYLEGRLRRHCEGWDRKVPDEEIAAFTKGALVDASSLPLAKDSPDLLTAMFGSMGEMILRVTDVRARFEKALEMSLLDATEGTGRGPCERKETVVDKIIEAQKNILKKAVALRIDSVPEIEQRLVPFPKLLLYGETGVGKSLVSRYLQSDADRNASRPLRILIPEFIGKEEDFEYALFGYTKGAYTGGLEQGSVGLLVENMGKVVFLDEIEEANPIIQAKLLAYLDDYRVRPRGWLQKSSFFCPTFVVAATNCSVEELRRRGFRKDLLARFTDVEIVPPLRERKESMDFLIDTLLQQNAINRDQKVQVVGRHALEKLKAHSYMNGNFRELEDVLRNACMFALRDGRNYLCATDIQLG